MKYSDYIIGNIDSVIVGIKRGKYGFVLFIIFSALWP